VAFELVAGRGLTWPQAMTVVFLEGVVITALVLTRFREAMLHAVPLGLKRAISVEIGLFIAFIGFFTSGFVVKPATGPLPVGLGSLSGLPTTIFLLGFLPTWLVMRARVWSHRRRIDAMERNRVASLTQDTRAEEPEPIA
jgi:AGZA family xanthine/uracil permease-like MFS transporter